MAMRDGAPSLIVLTFSLPCCSTHRLNTVMDSDFILVMADGMAGEFDTPQKLLQKPGGLFRELARAAARE